MEIGDFLNRCRHYRIDTRTLTHECPACGDTADVQIGTRAVVLGFLSGTGPEGFSGVLHHRVDGLKVEHFSDRVEITLGPKMWAIPVPDEE